VENPTIPRGNCPNCNGKDWKLHNVREKTAFIPTSQPPPAPLKINSGIVVNVFYCGVCGYVMLIKQTPGRDVISK